MCLLPQHPRMCLLCPCRGNAYRKAVDLARKEFPGEVVGLEDAWGDWLMSQRQVDAAINHFIEAGQTLKAIDAALAAKQWSKAATLIESQVSPVPAYELQTCCGVHLLTCP